MQQSEKIALTNINKIAKFQKVFKNLTLEKDLEYEDRVYILSCAIVLDPAKNSHARVSFGSTVTLVDVDTDEEIIYTIVGTPESNVDKSLISYNSPLAKAILSKEVGDEVEVNLPGGKVTYEIEKICFEEICFD
jgi:transcription elongation factor GreA